MKLVGINVTNVDKSKNANKKNDFLLTIDFRSAIFTGGRDTDQQAKRIRVRMNQNVSIANLTDVLLSIFAGLIKLKPEIFPSKPLPNFDFIKKVPEFAE